MARKEYLDAYIYSPVVDSKEYESLIVKINSEERVTSGQMGVNEYVVCNELNEDSIPPAYLFFGKDMIVPVGVGSQKAGCQNGLIKLDYVVGILHDAQESLKRGYRENIEGVMQNKLGLKSGSLKYEGLFSGELDKIVIDFEDTSYL